MTNKIAPALALAFLLAAGISYPGAHYPDVCLVSGEAGSILCAGLIEHFELTDPTDSPRFGAGMSYLQEAPGVDVTYDSGVQGGPALSLSGGTTNYLWANVTAPADSFTIAFRVKVTSLGFSGQIQSILSWHNSSFKGPDIYFENNGGTGRICLGVYEAETTTTSRTACQNASASTWYFVVVGASRYHDGKANIFISLNNAARTATSVSYWQHGGPAYLRIGGRPLSGPSDVSDQTFTGFLAELDFFSRPISEYEQTLLYNTGGAPSNAIGFPYDTN